MVVVVEVLQQMIKKSYFVVNKHPFAPSFPYISKIGYYPPISNIKQDPFIRSPRSGDTS